MNEDKINVQTMELMDSPKTFDVIGKAREFLEDLEINMDAAGIYQSMGVNPDKTFLLEGPPGTGKTFCMQAFNNTKNSFMLERMLKAKPKDVIRYNDFKVLMFPYDIGRYGTAYINMGSRRVQQYFDHCFAVASMGIPTISVMDEFDAVGQSRASSASRGHNEDKKVLETIMKNLQVAHDLKNMYVVLMTNESESCDEAVLRAGRIDKKYKLELPTIEERSYAFKRAISKINDRAGYSVIRGANLGNLAELSEGFNYADIYSSVEGAVKQRAKEIYYETADIVKPGRVHRQRLEDYVSQHKQSYHAEKKRSIGFK